MAKIEFVDQARPLQDNYYRLMERFDTIKRQSAYNALKRLIKKDPDFLEPYLVLSEMHLEKDNVRKAFTVLEEAYKRAVNLITDRNGNWPARLQWGHYENRHIIRALLHKALTDWEFGNTDKALALLRKLLSTNPNDNIGARYYILAILLGFSFHEFEGRFNKGGFYDMDLTNWFTEHYHLFPAEFSQISVAE